MNEDDLFRAYGVAPELDLAARARAAVAHLWAHGGVRALEPCIRGCGTLLLPPRVYCHSCLERERLDRREPQA